MCAAILKLKNKAYENQLVARQQHNCRNYLPSRCRIWNFAYAFCQAARAALVARLLAKTPTLRLAIDIARRQFRLTVGQRIEAQAVDGQRTIGAKFPLLRMGAVALAKAELGPDSRGAQCSEAAVAV